MEQNIIMHVEHFIRNSRFKRTPYLFFSANYEMSIGFFEILSAIEYNIYTIGSSDNPRAFIKFWAGASPAWVAE